MTEPHAAPAAEPHEPTRAAIHAAAADGHGAAAGHGDHGEDAPLGPVDAQAWGAGILGVAVGGLVAALLYVVSYH
ncbi:MAG TPA: hypothetical protein VMH24_00975 [Candidatus Sulfotelmatobacter sp.]|nr:hypothetical protein [Candidatus Sulfotelmatobacter sp.]